MQLIHCTKLSLRNFSRAIKTTPRVLATLLILFAMGTLPTIGWTHEFSAGNLVIEHPWSRATPPGAKVGGAYFTMTNNGKERDQLIAASADVAERAEFHRMSMNGDVMTMAKLEKPISIDPGETIYFEPGSLHLMLFGLKQPLLEGKSFSGTLEFEKAGITQLSFKIDKLGVRLPSVFAGEEMDHSTMQHD